MQTGPRGECVADLERVAIVLGFWHGHASPNGIAAPKKRSEVRLKGNPQGCDDQMVGTGDRSSSPLGVVLRATVPPAHRVRIRSLWESD